MLPVGVTGIDKGAPTGSGSVSGTVSDTSGAALPGAQIVMQPGAVTACNPILQGDFLIQNITPGTYTVTISDVGFTNSISTIVVAAGANTLTRKV